MLIKICQELYNSNMMKIEPCNELLTTHLCCNGDINVIKKCIMKMFISPDNSDTQCPSVMLYPADMPCSGPVPSSDLFNHGSVFSLTQMGFCPGM